MTSLSDRLRPALKLLPVECHDTPDYAEATGPQFQAMTMTPEAFLALNELPAAIDKIDQLVEGLREALEHLRLTVPETMRDAVIAKLSALIASVEGGE